LKTFQQPLSTEQEAQYIQLLHADDPVQAARAREILIEKNLRLVAHIAKKYQNMEDLISIGTIGLIKAIESFDAGKGKLSTYASRCIDNEFLMLLRSKKKNSREVSLFEPIGTDKEGNEISLLDVIEQVQEDVVERMYERESIRRLKILMQQVLTHREREIIELRYGLQTGTELTQREVGERFGISRSYVSRIEKRALLKLREGLKTYNCGSS
jgi:RNA polymerase sporulation-specific sigma factor